MIAMFVKWVSFQATFVLDLIHFGILVWFWIDLRRHWRNRKQNEPNTKMSVVSVSVGMPPEEIV